MNSVKISNTFVDIIIWKKEEYHIASLRLIKFTSLPGRLKISNTSTGRERISKVRYLELTIHKTPCCLPHRYEPDQTCILPTRKEDTSSSINSASSRQTSACYLTGHRWGWRNRIKRFSWKKEGSYAVEETDTWTKHFDTTLICKLSTPSPDKFACCARHGLEEVRIEEDSRRQGKGGTRGGKSLDTGLGPESSFAVHKAVQRDSLSHFNFPRMNIEVSVTRRIWN